MTEALLVPTRPPAGLPCRFVQGTCRGSAATLRLRARPRRGRASPPAGGDEEGRQADKPRASQTVTVATAHIGTLARTVEACGTISAWEEVPVGAETGGLTVVRLLVDEGDYVRQGQPLVQMNDSPAGRPAAPAAGRVPDGRGQCSPATAALARAQELKDRGFLSQASLDTVAAQRSAAANVELAQARPVRDPDPSGPGHRPRAGVRPDHQPQRHARPDRRGRGANCSASSATAGWSWTPRCRKPNCPCPRRTVGRRHHLRSGRPDDRPRPHRHARGRPADPRWAWPGSPWPVAAAFRPGMFASAAIDVGAQPAVSRPDRLGPVPREPRRRLVLERRQPGPFPGGDRPARAAATTSRSATACGPARGWWSQGAGFLGEGDRVNVVATPRRAGAR